MPLAPQRGDLHITKDHDAGRIRVEQTAVVFPTGWISVNGSAYKVHNVEVRELVSDNPLTRRPGRRRGRGEQ